MKKLNEICKWIIGSAFVVTGIATIILFLIHNIIPERSVKIIVIIITIAFLLIVLSVVISSIINIFRIMKQGFHNIKKCDDPIFMEIDRFSKYWKESKENYIKRVQIINLFYEEGGEVDKLVKNGEIDRLYARADYLLVQSSLHDVVATYYSSLILSVIASFLCQMMEFKNVFLMIIWAIGILVSFFLILLLRYYERGQDGSYRHYIEEYERKLLLKKIEDLEKTLKIVREDKDLLETKQVIIEFLIEMANKCKKNKQKKIIISDINLIEKLDLCIKNADIYYKQLIYINNKKCYLLYNKEKGEENNYIGKLNLATKDFAILYEIIEKYNLIQYSMEINSKS